MAKALKNEALINKIKKCGYITEREILLIKSRLNYKRANIEDFDFLGDTDIYVTCEQAEKGLKYLRKHLLTMSKKPRKRCTWGEYELNDIGWNGENEDFTNLKYHHLFKVVGFMNVGRCVPYYEPIYEIGNTDYYMKDGEPTIY